MAKIVAKTERLILRDWEDEDEARFFGVMNSNAVMQHLGGVQTFESGARGSSESVASPAISGTPSGSSKTEQRVSCSAFAA